MNENEMQMRSLFIYGTEDVNLLEKLSNVPDWVLQPLGIEGSFEFCLSKGKEKVALHITAPNVISTANVLPHDSKNDQPKANDLLKQLSNALTDAGIDNIITASESDLAFQLTQAK